LFSYPYIFRFIVICVHFLFQAEDGIRDFHVTGVQTCALPIWSRTSDSMCCSMRAVRVVSRRAAMSSKTSTRGSRSRMEYLLVVRSEERRVGKECCPGGDMEGKTSITSFVIPQS